MKKKILAIAVTLLVLGSTVQPEDFSWSDWAKEGIEKARINAEKMWSNITKGFEELKSKLVTKIEKSFDEKEGKYIITIELPGYDGKDIEVKVTPEKIVTIKAEKKVVKEEKTDGTVKSASFEKYFEQSFTIPQNIIVTDEKATTASYKNGILTVKVPAKMKKVEKKKEEEKAVEVKVTTE